MYDLYKNRTNLCRYRTKALKFIIAHPEGLYREMKS